MESRSGAKTSTSDAGLYASYGDLARRLLPRAVRITFFDGEGTLAWSHGTGRVADYPAESLIKQLVPGGGVEAATERLSDNLVATAIPIVINGKPVSILLVHTAADMTQPDRRVMREVLSTAAPLLDCMCRELSQVRRKEMKGATLTERTEELEWLFALTESLHSNSNDPRAVRQLLGAAVERMKCCFGAVIVPDHSLDVTYASLVHIEVQANGAFDRIKPFFLSFAQRRRQALVANKISATQNMPQFKMLVVPIEPHKDRIIGYIAFLKNPTLQNFGRRQLFLARHLAHQIGALLESQYDMATGLLTRNAFDQDVGRLLGAEDAGRVHSMLYFDIDHLHVVNDTLGFDAGDDAIMRIADLLRAPALSEDAIAARLGGDTFAVFLPDHDAEQAGARAQAVLDAARASSVGTGDNRTPLSLSCGIVRLIERHTGIEGPLITAEMACNSAKQHGGNRAEVYLDMDQSRMRRRDDILDIANLRTAIAESRFCMYAQKIVAAGDLSRVHGVECLIRMVGENGEIVNPAEFLPSAQRYQMLQAIDNWVITKSLRELKPYRAMLLEGRISVSINISGQSVQDDVFAEAVERWLLDCTIAPALIRFEISEPVAIANLARAQRLIRRLRQHGCGFALDDFGTAVNSLSYLKCLPVNCIKIDAGFVRDLLSNSRTDGIVRILIDAARSLDIESIAKCVESHEVALRLRNLGIDYIQGFVAHRPEPLRELLDSLQNAESQRLHQLFLAQ